MKKGFFTGFGLAIIAVFGASDVFGQQTRRTPFDVTNYKIDVELSPVDNKLTATSDVTFTPLEDARSVAFELNGSLKVDSITRVAAGSTLPAPTGRSQPRTTATASQITFVQDQVGVSDIGPNVRIDLARTLLKHVLNAPI